MRTLPLYLRTIWNATAKYYNVISNTLSVTSRKKYISFELNISSVTRRNSPRYTEFHNYVPFERNGTRRRPYFMQKHCISLAYNQWPFHR